MHSHTDINLIALELDFEGRAFGGNRVDRCMALVRAVEQGKTPEAASAALLQLAERELASYNEWQGENVPEIIGLTRALQIEGFVFQDGRLLPTTPGPIALDREISQLERQLQDVGFQVALRHYQQAVDSFVEGNSEAANGQLRSFIEDLFISLCQRYRQHTFEDASAALQHLKDTNWLDIGEWNNFRSFWADIQDNGPHRGLSSPEEALFRLHMGTAIARYLLAKSA